MNFDSSRLSGSLDRQFLKKLFFFVASILAFIAVWEVIAVAVNNQQVMSYPSSSFVALIDMVENHLPPLATGITNVSSGVITLVEITLLGFGLSLVGIPLGSLMGRWKFAESIIDPWVNAWYAIPIVALVPVMYFAGGGGFYSDVFVAFFMAVFAVILNTYDGVRGVSSSLAEVGKSFGSSEIQFWRYILLPASVPDVIAGMRLGMGRSLLGAVTAQAILSVDGIGYLMMSLQDTLQTSYMVATIIIITLIGILTQQGMKLVERHFSTWRETEKQSGGR